MLPFAIWKVDKPCILRVVNLPEVPRLILLKRHWLSGQCIDTDRKTAMGIGLA